MKVNEVTFLNLANSPLLMVISLEDYRDIDQTACRPKISAQVSIGEKSKKVTYEVRGLIY